MTFLFRRTPCALLAGAALVASVLAAPAAPLPQQQPADRLAALHREAEALASQEKTLLVELRQLEVERELKSEELRRVTQQLADSESEHGALRARIAALESQVGRQRPAVAARLVELYKLGRPGYARLLLDLQGAQSALRAYRTVAAIVEADKRKVSAFRRDLDQLHASERQLADRRTRTEALRLQAQTAKAAADRAVARHSTLVAEIDARRDLTARLAGDLQDAQQKLSALVPPQAGVAPASAVSLIALRGALDWPAAGSLTAPFGPRRDARFGTTTVRAGVDIGASPGADAQAVHDGVVAFADPFAGFGNLVIVDHGQQAYSLYGYLDSIAVGRGARVARGQALGKVGRAPNGKAALYFELRIDGRAVDPVQWLKKR